MSMHVKLQAYLFRSKFNILSGEHCNKCLKGKFQMILYLYFKTTRLTLMDSSVKSFQQVSL